MDLKDGDQYKLAPLNKQEPEPGKYVPEWDMDEEGNA